jgi:CheY-like chemotaxis protein
MAEQLKVLVADDNKDIRKLCQLALEDEGGYQVTLTRSGEEVLAEVVKPPPPDVILLDLQMEGISGLEVARLLEQGKIGTPIIFITGLPRSDVEGRIRLLEQPPRGVVYKPLDVDKLGSNIRRLLSAPSTSTEHIVFEPWKTQH